MTAIYGKIEVLLTLSFVKWFINFLLSSNNRFSLFLQKFYVLGTNTDKTLWRLLKIDRMEPSELNVDEECTVYSQSEYHDLLKALDEDHKSTGGVKFVTNCFGIIGKPSDITISRKSGDIFLGNIYQ
jgi:phosphatidylinositol 3,5-bisphosphate 5-phosphatase